MKQRSLKVTPGQICIILFRAIASTFISEPVRTCAPLWGLITSFLKGLGRLLGTGSLWEFSPGTRQGSRVQAFQCRFRGKVESFEHSSKNLVDPVLQGSQLVMGVTRSRVKRIFLA